MKKLFFIIIISLIYISCEKIIPFEPDITIPKLVINSIFESDSSFKVHVSSSRSVIDTASFEIINDAVVSIKNENGDPQLSQFSLFPLIPSITYSFKF